MLKPYANLHLHSTHSDGKFTPEELVMTAKAEGYKAIAVTDHDTVTANDEVARICDREGMEHIFGAEFSVKATLGPHSAFHITAFDFNPTTPAMKRHLIGMGERETEFTHAIFNESVKQGKIKGITWNEVMDYNEGIVWLCNEHIFRAMVAKGLYKPSDYETFWNECYYHVPAPADYVEPYHFPDAKTLIGMIRDAGGIPVLAHPHLQLGYVDELMKMGLLGMEVFHPDLLPQEQVRAMKIAYEKGLFISGGTDHSGLCGGEYVSFEHPEETGYYLLPCSFGVMEQHFWELKNRSLEGRKPLGEVYFACRANTDFDI